MYFARASRALPRATGPRAACTVALGSQAREMNSFSFTLFLEHSGQTFKTISRLYPHLPPDTAANAPMTRADKPAASTSEPQPTVVRDIDSI